MFRSPATPTGKTLFSICIVTLIVPSLLAGLASPLAGKRPQQVLAAPLYDYGDAPAPYSTLRGNKPAAHTIVPGLHLGASVDDETDVQPDATATGDDNDGQDDEDGVTFLDPLVAGNSVDVEVVASGACTLYAWVDFGIDGDWDTAGDDVFPGGVALAPGTNQLSFAVPLDARAGNSYARFRCTTDDGVSYHRLASDGEVEDYMVFIGQPGEAMDWGDAPAPTYPSLNADGGASHVLGGRAFLGSSVDAEPDGQPTSAADGDDITGADDEDGVKFLDALAPGSAARVAVAATAPCTLSAWIDFDADGDWGTAGDDLFPGGQALIAGTNILNFSVPGGATIGTTTYARFRCTTDGPVSYTGPASDGEVEDYQVTIRSADLGIDFGDAPPPYPTLRGSTPAAHTIVPGLHLGASVDGEPDGQPDATATGDDNNGQDDEDGVTFLGALAAGSTVDVEVEASGACTLYAWVDFGIDGDWGTAGDDIFPGGIPLAPGANQLSFAVPLDARAGESYARFRCTTDDGVSFRGLASDGEVEDYAVSILGEDQWLDAGQDQSAIEGDEVQFAGFFLTFGTAGPYDITWYYGDGTSKTVSLNPTTTGQIPLTSTHVYADDGAYEVAVSLTHDGQTVTDGLRVTVQNALPTVEDLPDQVASEGEWINLSAGFNDPGTLDTHTATIEWGDGSAPDVGVVTETPFGPPGSTAGMDGTVTGSHVYADNGLYTVTVCVADDDAPGSPVCDTHVVTVTNVAPTVQAGLDQVIYEGDTVTLDPATFADPGFDDPVGGTEENFTAAIDWGDGTGEPPAGITLAETPGAPGVLTTGTVQATHQYLATPGIYTVTVTVEDDDGGAGSDTLNVIIVPGFLRFCVYADGHNPGVIIDPEVTLNCAFVPGGVPGGQRPGGVGSRGKSHVKNTASIAGDVVSLDGKVDLEYDVNLQGDLTAGGDVKIKSWSLVEGSVTSEADVQLMEDSTVLGDVTAAGKVKLAPGASVGGVVTKGADVPPIPDITMVVLSLTAGEQDVTVERGDSLAPDPQRGRVRL
jgi:hypothetical protein